MSGMVVRKDEDGRDVVGHWNPKGEFEVFAIGEGAEDAARLLNYLHGGPGPLFPPKDEGK